MIIHDDCLTAMAAMEPESVDAIVTDPPYLLKFMGKSWDGPTQLSGHATPDAATVGFYQAVGKGGSHDAGMDNWNPNWMQRWHQQWAEAAFRVAKPSAYLLAFGGTRTVHRMTVALEDAGWIIRDMLVWAYASGFPKSKASLKPAWEPIVMARKPGPLRELAIDACRIPTDEQFSVPQSDPAKRSGIVGKAFQATGDVGRNHESQRESIDRLQTLGRWPANVILTDPIFDGGVEGVVGGGETTSGSRNGAYGGSGSWSGQYGPVDGQIDGDSGTYSRFFLIAKSSRSDREPVLGGLTGLEPQKLDNMGDWPNDAPSKSGGLNRRNVHPTVKPVDLMRHLVRLVTPAGGTVLDPFLGSGTTGLAAEMEGFPWIGIEREAEYVAIAEARLNGTQRGLGLDVPAPTPRNPNTDPDLSKHQPKRRAPGENWSGRWAGTDTDEIPA